MDRGVAHGLMFHHFHSEVHPRGQGSMSGDEFRDMILFYGRENFLGAREWFDRALAGTLEPHHVCLTFDDNLRCQYDVALPVMNELGISGFWFVYTSVVHGVEEPLEVFREFRSSYADIDGFYADFFGSVEGGELAGVAAEGMERYDSATFLADFPFYSENDKRFRFMRDDVLTKEQYEEAMYGLMREKGFDVAGVVGRLWMDRECLRELHEGGHVVGLHSYTHPTRMNSLSLEEQRVEYAANALDLREILGGEPVAMSHPCNSYNDDTIEVLKEMGVRLGFRANMAKRQENIYEFPRIDHAIVLREMRESR